MHNDRIDKRFASARWTILNCLHRSLLREGIQVAKEERHGYQAANVVEIGPSMEGASGPVRQRTQDRLQPVSREGLAHLAAG